MIKFKIGDYHDELLCDVAPMQACHLLLGRPWQYDRYTRHEGRTNKYVLQPMTPSQVGEVYQKLNELKEKSQGKRKERDAIIAMEKEILRNPRGEVE